MLVLDSLLHSCFNVGRFRGGVGSSRSPSSISGSSSRPVAIAVYQYNSCLNVSAAEPSNEVVFEGADGTFSGIAAVDVRGD